MSGFGSKPGHPDAHWNPLYMPSALDLDLSEDSGASASHHLQSPELNQTSKASNFENVNTESSDASAEPVGSDAVSDSIASDSNVQSVSQVDEAIENSVVSDIVQQSIDTIVSAESSKFESNTSLDTSVEKEEDAGHSGVFIESGSTEKLTTPRTSTTMEAQRSLDISDGGFFANDQHNADSSSQPAENVKSNLDDLTAKKLEDQGNSNDTDIGIQHSITEHQNPEFSLDEEPAELSFNAESNPFFEQTIVEEVQENSENEVETLQYSVDEKETSSPLASAKNSPVVNITKSHESSPIKKTHERVISVFGAPGEEDSFLAAINQASSRQSSPQQSTTSFLEPSAVEDDKRLSVFAASPTNGDDSFFESLASQKNANQVAPSSESDNLFSETSGDNFFDNIGSSNEIVHESDFAGDVTNDSQENTVILQEDEISSLASVTQSSAKIDEENKPQPSASKSEFSSSTFSFLENDDDLLPDDLEEEAPLASSVVAGPAEASSTGPQQNKYAPASAFSSTLVSSSYTNLHAAGHGTVPSSHPATSSLNKKPATNAFDLPTNIVPKPSVRPSASLQALHSTGSSYFTLPQMVPPSQNISASAASVPNHSSTTAQPKVLQKSKSFFEDLPLPNKRSISRQQSMTVVAPGASRRSSSSQNQQGFPPTNTSVYGQPAQELPHTPQLQSSQSFNGRPMAPVSSQTPYAHPAQSPYSQQPVQNAYAGAPLQSPYAQPAIQSPYAHPGFESPYIHSAEQSALTSAASLSGKLQSPPNPYAQVASVSAIPAAASRIQSPPNPYAQPSILGASQNTAVQESQSHQSRINHYSPAVVSGTSRSSTPGSVNPYAPPVGGNAYVPNAAHARTLSNNSNHSVSPKSSQQSPYAPSYTYASPPPGGHPASQKVRSSYTPVSAGTHTGKHINGTQDLSDRISTQILKPPYTAPSRNQSLGDLPLDITKRASLDSNAHRFRAPQSYSNGPGFDPSSANSVSTPEHRLPVDNEALLRRQFPIFNWNNSGKVSYVIPAVVSYGSVNAPLSVKVSPVQNILNDPEFANFSKFPGPLVSNKGVIKGKKKELEKWIDEKLSLMEAKNDPVSNDRIILWKFLRLLVSREEHISKMGQDTLESIALLLNPRSGFKESKTENFSSGLDLYKQQQAQFSSHSRSSSIETSGLVNGTSNSMSSYGNKAIKADVRSLYSSIEIGDRDGALKYCLDKGFWAHALIIASSLGSEVWNQTVADFVKSTVEPIESSQSRGLSFMYRVFSGGGELSLAALKSTKPLSANLQNDYHEKQETLQNLSEWRTYLASILLNESPKANEAILGMGKLLLEYGLVDAGHMCIILSGVPSFGSPESSGITLVGADNRALPVGIGKDPDTLLMSEVYEYVLLNNSPSAVLPSPHLLMYKLQHSILLADFGFLALSQKNYESVSSLVKSNNKIKFNPAFLSRLEDVGKWLSAESSGSSWLSSKKLDRALLQSFNKFVAGDDTSSSESTNVGADGAIFKRLASTPGPHQQPTPWSADGSPYTGTSGQTYGPSDHTLSRAQSTGVLRKPMGSYDSYPPPSQAPELNRTYSHSALDQGNLQDSTPQYGGYAPMNQIHEPELSSVSYGGDYSSTAVANSRRYSNSSSGHGGSRPHTPLTGHDQFSAGYQPYNPASSAPVSRPSSSQRARMSPYSPERLSRPATSSAVQAVQNPYAPVTGTAHLKSSVPVGNPYAPIGNPYAPVGSSSVPDLQEGERRDSTVSDVSAAPISYGYNPYGGSQNPEATELNSGSSKPYEASNGQDDGWTEPQSANYEPNTTDSYGDSPNGWGATSSGASTGYDPEGGDMLPPVNDDLINDAENGSAPGSGYYTPNDPPGFAPNGPSLSTVPSYSSYQTASTVIPEENEDEFDDLGISNKKPEKNVKDEAKDDTKKDNSGKDDHKESKGWFGWLRKNQEHDDKPKAVRAKLGEQSSFYYDKELKRWVNKNAPAEDNKPAAPPPPPKSLGGSSSISRPSSSTPGLPSGPPSTSSTPVSGPPSAVLTPSGPPGPSTTPRPPVKINGGLDDLLASAPTTGGSKRPKKNARSRYVDVMAQK